MICYDYITSYIRNTIKKSEGLLAELEKFAQENHVPIIQPEVASLLTVLGQLAKPARVLEVGTAIGYSAILLAGIMDCEGKLDTIERYDLMAEKAQENIKKAGLDEKISIIRGEALDILRCLDKQYDLIFLDAAKGQYKEFLSQCSRMLKPGGILVSDNVLYKGMVASDELVVRRKKTIVNRMRDYLVTLCNDDEFDTSIIPIGDGVAVSYKKMKVEG